MIGEFISSSAGGLVGTGILVYLVKDKLLGTAKERQDIRDDIEKIINRNPVSQEA